MFAKQPALTVEEALKLDLTCYREGNEPSRAGWTHHSFKHARLLILDRPKALNALNLRMAHDLRKAIEIYENHENVHLIFMIGMTGDKPAFCAGGDIIALHDAAKNYRAGMRGSQADTRTFFAEEYALNYQIASLTTPYVAVLNGVTMGGGVGLSVHGRYRIATEQTVFAMPETGIGFFPDVGGSYFLPRLRGQLGMYLALTGARLKGDDVFHAGIATHLTSSDGLHEVVLSAADVEPGPEYVDEHMTAITEDPKHALPFTLEPHLETIDECFSGDSLEEVIDNLEADGSNFSMKALQTIRRMSPLSLKVTFKQLRRGEKLSLEKCLRMEYRLATRFLEREDSDFVEGVRSLLIDRVAPSWRFKSVEEVPDALIDEYFEPLPLREELLLGTLSPEQAEIPKLYEKYFDPVEVAKTIEVTAH